jgi:hypothetical protein
MDDGIKGRKIGSTYMTWVGSIGLASLIVCLALLGTASLGLWPQSGGGGLEFGGIPPERSFSSEPEKRKGNGNPAASDRSLPPATPTGRTFNAGAASGTGGDGGRRGTSKEPNRPNRHKSSPVASIPARTPPGHGGTPPGHGGTPPGHGVTPPGHASGLGPPGQLKK